MKTPVNVVQFQSKIKCCRAGTEIKYTCDLMGIDKPPHITHNKFKNYLLIMNDRVFLGTNILVCAYDHHYPRK
jgi:hypothetical protein